jgi:hypothetical protein
LARKIVKVYLTPEMKKPLEKKCISFGMDESEVLRHTLLEYAQPISLVTDKVHGKLRNRHVR